MPSVRFLASPSELRARREWLEEVMPDDVVPIVQLAPTGDEFVAFLNSGETRRAYKATFKRAFSANLFARDFG